MKNIAIIDAHNHLHRFHHVIPEDVSLCHQWGKMLASLIRDLKLHRAVAVFDPLEKEAKAGRPETPDRLKRDQPKIERMCKAIGMQVVKPSHLNEEADQLIADVFVSLPYMDLKDSVNVYVASSDKDFAQLVCIGIVNLPPREYPITVTENGLTMEIETYPSFHSYLARPENGSWKTYGPKEVLEKWGVKPTQMADYLTLLGDAIDGIEGVKGIGEKTAAKLLNTHFSLKHMVETLEATGKLEGLSERLTENLKADLPNLQARKARISLLGRNMNLHAGWLSQPVSTKEVLKEFGTIGLSDIVARVMENKLWSK